MVKKSSLLIGTGLLIILLSAAYISVTFYQKQQLLDTSFASITPLTRQLMVVDMNQLGVFDSSMVASGQLPILSIHQDTNFGDYSKIELDFLDHAGRLVVFDSNNSNRIDNMDPVYSRLELVYITQGRIISTTPIAAVGIRAIYLDKGNLTQTELFPNGPKGYWNVANTAIMADGSTRAIRVIPMDANQLPNMS